MSYTPLPKGSTDVPVAPFSINSLEHHLTVDARSKCHSSAIYRCHWVRASVGDWHTKVADYSLAVD
jgi:hypothetical protein